MALAIGSNKHHAHTYTHTPPVTRRAATRAWCCLLPSPTASSSTPRLPDPHTNTYPNHPATSPPPPQTPPPPSGMPAAVCLKEALCARRKTHSCAAEPSSYVCIVIHTHTHTHAHHSHRRLPERELVLLCLCETTIVSPSYASHHGIHHIIINDIYIYIEREREGGSARGGC